MSPRVLYCHPLAACLTILLAGGAADAGQASYRYYRFTPTKLRSWRANSVQLAEFELRLNGQRTATPVASNPGGNNPVAETPAKAVDEDLNTKWLDFNKKPLVLDCGTALPIDGYRWATANDTPERDPVRWKLEGSHDNLNWSLLDNRTGSDYPTPTERFAFLPTLDLNQLPSTPAIGLSIGDGTISDQTAIWVAPGNSVTLSWTTTNATNVTLDSGSGPQTVATNGSFTDLPSSTRLYTVQASNASGSVSAAATAVVGGTPAPLVINEFMANAGRDGAVLLDQDGEPSDWIELHNPNPFALHLGGHCLTDDPLQPARWQFPTGTTLGPAAYLLVFASGKDRAVAGAQLHTNFSLDAAGEFLALVAPDGSTVLDSLAPAYPPQFENVAYGRAPPAAGGSFNYFVWPTPGAANDSTPGPPGEAVRFLTTASTFQTSIAVELAVTSPTAAIRYTTDGSLPDENSPLYAGPIPLSASALVRARSYDNGSAPGEVKAQAYLKIDPAVAAWTSNLPVVVIENFGAGPVPSDRDLQTAYLTLFEPEPASGRTRLTTPPADANRAGIKRRGSSTLNDPKGNYRIEFWRDDSELDKNVRLLDLSDHDEWILTAPYSFDRSLVRVSFAHDLSNAIGAYAPRSRFCEVYLNTGGGPVTADDYQGVYVLQERISRDPARVDVERLDPSDIAEPQVTGGYILSIDRPDPEDRGFRSALGHPEDPAIASPQPMFNYIYPKEQNIMPQQANYIRAYIDKLEAALYGPDFKDPQLGYQAWLDRDASIDHHILRTFTKDPDALRLSTYLRKPRGGKLAFGPVWDFDRTMGCDNDDRSSNPQGWDPPYETAQFFLYDWWGRLFQDPDFWQRWIDRWQSLRDGEFANDRLAARVDALAAQLVESQPRNQARWPEVTPNGGQLSALPGWAGEIDHLKNWLAQRATWIDTQFTRRPALQAGGVVAAGTVVSAAPASGTLYYTTDGSDPRLPGGGVAPSAIPLAAGAPGIAVQATVTVTARTLDGANWSGPAGETYVVGEAASPANLVVSEIMYHPLDPTPAEQVAGFASQHDFEFLELLNVGPAPIDLAGVAIADAVDFSFSGAAITLLAPGETVLVVRNRAAFEARYGTGLPVAGAWGDPVAPDGGARLDNAGERILVRGIAGTIRDFFYDDGPGWPQAADGNGPSLVLSDPFSLPDHNLGSNWRASVHPLGTPGFGHAGLWQEWASLHFTAAELADPAISGPNADPDSDRLQNLLELAMGGDPKAPSPNLRPRAAIEQVDVDGQSNEFFTISFTRRTGLPGVAAIAQFSDNLVDWSETGVLLRAVDNGDGTESVVYRDAAPAAGSSRRFARVIANAP